LKCSAAEGCRRSVEPVVWKMKEYDAELRRKVLS